ncbi:hypothetical protein D3C80_2158580 [compost metagenome]
MRRQIIHAGQVGHGIEWPQQIRHRIAVVAFRRISLRIATSGHHQLQRFAMQFGAFAAISETVG